MPGYSPHSHGHPLAERPHILGRWASKDLEQQGFDALRHQLGGTLDVEDKGPKDSPGKPVAQNDGQLE